MSFLSVGEAAKALAEQYGGGKLKPQHITSLFYQGRLRDDLCPVVAGRRLIPLTYLDGIAVELRRAGKLPQLRKGVAHVQ